MILQELKKQNIKNILLFVSDSLRWDYTPKNILSQGVSLKTIASSLYTAPSFPSLISGLYPPKTGIYNWGDTLKKNLRGIFNFKGYQHSLWCETTWTNSPPWESDLHNVLGKPNGVSLQDIQPPFIYVEDDKGGHCPYGIPFGTYKSFHEFYRDYGKKGNAALRKQYSIGVKESENNFNKRIKILEERGLLDETLVIFTSDHGELLGEYGGLVGHGRPPCPELVYVPTVFIHPSLQPQQIKNGLMRHVDVLPTIASILNQEVKYKTDGLDITTCDLATEGLNFRIGGYFKSQKFIEKLFDYKAISLWDMNGGHIFHYLNQQRSYFFFLYSIFIEKHPEFAYFNTNLKINSHNRLKDSKNILYALAESHISYGSPKKTKQEAKETIQKKLIESERFKEQIKINEALQKIKIKNIKI